MLIIFLALLFYNFLIQFDISYEALYKYNILNVFTLPSKKQLASIYFTVVWIITWKWQKQNCRDESLKSGRFKSRSDVLTREEKKGSRKHLKVKNNLLCILKIISY